MHVKKIDEGISVAEQLHESDIPELKIMGFTLIVCNRPDDEASNQPSFMSIEAAANSVGLTAIHLPFSGTQLSGDVVDTFKALMMGDEKIVAYCRTGNRSCNLWAAASAKLGRPPDALIAQASELGYDVSHSVKLYSRKKVTTRPSAHSPSLAKPLYDIVIVGAGSAGIAISASLLRRNKRFRIAIIDPAEDHYCQPIWTMVGAGIFAAKSTKKSIKKLIPKTVSWIRQSVVSFTPQDNTISLDDRQDIYYKQLIVCPGLKLNWSSVEGLEETLGKNGVTSSYRYDLAAYTWELIKSLQGGRALFTEQPMPIKGVCAPQNALYLSADYWHRRKKSVEFDIHFFSAAGAQFPLDLYLHQSTAYIDKYEITTHSNQQLIKIDGGLKKAWFSCIDQQGEQRIVERDFDMIHVCPAQMAPDFISRSPLADSAGWLDVDAYTLQHKQYDNIWGLGDVINTTNAKTLGAVRKQVPVVAQNIHDASRGIAPRHAYDGYASCTISFERGQALLAEFGYAEKMLPTFPRWLLSGKKPSALAWWLTTTVFPVLYWHGMLKGRELCASPKPLETTK
mgnify:CR=1 FL=1